MLPIIDAQPRDVLRLFRALHAWHAALDPAQYHCDGPDTAYLSALDDRLSGGGQIFGHDAGWGLVSYMVVMPDARDAGPLMRARHAWRVDHVYVAPTHRNRGLGGALFAELERRMTAAGIPVWRVTFHGRNTEAARLYARLGGVPHGGALSKRL